METWPKQKNILRLLMQKAILVDIITPSPPELSLEDRKSNKNNQLEELTRLVETYGGIVIAKIIQQRRRPSAKTFMGTGKAQEVSDLVHELKADILLVNDFLKPAQVENLSKLFHDPKSNTTTVKIWDRTDIILNIFEKHATTQQAKLQIKLARLHHEIPRVYQYQARLFDKERGGIGGTRGAGEKGIEQEKRHIRSQIKSVEEQLEQVRKTHINQRKHRQRSGLKTVALVGYTNAGKSTLLRSLTQKNVYVANELFATLDTRIGGLWLEELGQKVLIADTIGFIQNLPPHLIEAFKTTLSEVAEADLLLHVIDASDPEMEHKVKIVEQILESLHVNTTPIIRVYNKSDAPQVKNPEGITVSALKKEGLEELKKEITKNI